MKRIKVILEKNRITSKTLAENLGNSFKMLISYIQNIRRFRIEINYKIAHLLEVDICNLLLTKASK